MVGADGLGFTVTDEVEELAAVHAPFVTTALKYVVSVRVAVVYEAVVAPEPPLTFDQVELSIDDCH